MNTPFLYTADCSTVVDFVVVEGYFKELSAVWNMFISECDLNPFFFFYLFKSSNCHELAERYWGRESDGKYALGFILQVDVIKATASSDPDVVAGFQISKIVAAASDNTDNIIGSSLITSPK